MVINEDSFQNKRKCRIHTARWYPDVPAKAAVLFIHGYAEHCGRYRHLAEALAGDGIVLFSMDLQGHGASEGARCDINSYKEYVEDLSDYFGAVRQELPELPWFVMGHSMGGCLAVLLAHRHQHDLQGLILSAPLLKVVTNIPKVVQDMVRYVTALTPAMPVIGLDTRALSRDSNVVEGYIKDPLVYHGRVRARMAQQLVEAGEAALNVSGELSIPVWAGHGLADRITDQQGTREFMDHLSAPDKVARYYDDYYHEILQEPGHEEIISEIISWIDRHISSGMFEKDAADSASGFSRS